MRRVSFAVDNVQPVLLALGTTSQEWIWIPSCEHAVRIALCFQKSPSSEIGDGFTALRGTTFIRNIPHADMKLMLCLIRFQDAGVACATPKWGE